jgi:hypothetical protein
VKPQAAAVKKTGTSPNPLPLRHSVIYTQRLP